MIQRFKALAATGALVAGIAASGPAYAQNPIGELLEGFGILSQPRSEIEYRERAPLVLPPRGANALRTPEQPAAERTGAWPNDPDVERRRRSASNSLLPVPFEVGNPRPELPAGELRAGRRAVTPPQIARSQNENDRYELLYQPMQQMREADAKREAAATPLEPGVEPRRRSLAEPPTGYRRPTQIVKSQREGFIPVGDGTGQKEFVRQERRSYQ
ncbi:MAG: hypothetical protein ACRCUX_04205 [Beijerinckiaceae bacterium]